MPCRKYFCMNMYTYIHMMWLPSYTDNTYYRYATYYIAIHVRMIENIHMHAHVLQNIHTYSRTTIHTSYGYMINKNTYS